MAILEYASSLDAETARTLARSFEGTGNSTDRNTLSLREAVFTRWAELDAEGVIRDAGVSGDSSTRYDALLAGFSVLARKNPEAAWIRAGKMGILKDEAQRSVIDGLASSDPRTALKLCAKMEGLFGPERMGEIITTWAERDPSAAGKAASELPPGRARDGAIHGLMEKWAVADYAGAAAWAASLTSSQERETAMYSALNALSQRNPEKVLSLLESTELGDRRGQIVRSVISTMALKDFDGALTRASTFAGLVDKRDALAALAGAAGEKESARLLRLAESLPANLSRAVYESGVLQRMCGDPAGVLEAAAKIPLPAVREQALKNTAWRMSEYQPEQAAVLFSKLQPASQVPETAGRIAAAMARTDPEKAVEWASGLTNETLKKAALANAIPQWANSDPARAGQELAKITNTDTRADVARFVARSLVGRSLTEAENWADSLTGADRSAALGALVENAASQAPDRVEALYKRFTAGLSPEEAGRSENLAIAESVANQMARTDARRAAAWSLELPDGGARDEAVSGVVTTWAGYDAVAASEWLQNLPEGKGRDLAAGNLVGVIARDDPDGAWAWATSISDPVRRREAAASALAGWKANGQRAEAQAALDAGGFSAPEYEELKRRLE